MSPKDVEVNASESSQAGLAHLANLLLPALGPLGMYLAYREKSRFVAYHAIQAALFLPAGFALVLLVAKIGVSFIGPAESLGPGSQDRALFLLYLLGGFCVCLLFAVLAAQAWHTVAAFQGRWSRIWVVSTIADRITQHCGTAHASAAQIRSDSPE